MKIDKQILNEIKESLKFLPKDIYSALENYEISKEDAILSNIKKEDIEGSEKLAIVLPTVYEVNHLRRMKKAYKKGFKLADEEGGINEVKKYINNLRLKYVK